MYVALVEFSAVAVKFKKECINQIYRWILYIFVEFYHDNINSVSACQHDYIVILNKQASLSVCILEYALQFQTCKLDF